MPGTPTSCALNCYQAIPVRRARELLAADEQGTEALAAHLERKGDNLYPYALGTAMSQIRNLLGVIDELTGSAR
jgi:hypothetical protein